MVDFSALANEYFDMGTFTDDYFKNVIEPYKKGLTPKPNFLNSLRYARPFNAFLPESLGGTYGTKGSPRALNFLNSLKYGLGFGARALASAPATGIMTLFNSSGLNQGEEEFMKRINEQQNTMTTGQQILGQTPQQIINQQAASRNENRGNYQAPTMTAQQIVQEAKDTGGTVNPFEVTQAAQNERNQNNQSGGGGSNQTSRPRNSPSSRPRGPNLRFRAQGGIVSINDMIGRM